MKLFCIIIGVAFLLQGNAFSQTLRRPISPSQPLLMIHADVWNAADPQKIIDLIPADMRPYTVLNISLSINHDATTGAWLTSEYGYEIAKSWIRTAAENRVWATIQPSSGGFSHFPDYDTTANLDTTIYGEFFKNYPNFLGINYAEQFWGFDDKWSLSWTERVNHWENLMKLTNKYGGYLIVSFCGSFWGASINPLALVKRNPGFAAVLKKYPQNFIMEEKFTSTYGFQDIESTSMGMWLSGYAGHYGIRFDQCGWVPYASEAFPTSAGAIPYLEHMMLTGETLVDGPELIWQQSVKGLSDGSTTDGFSTRRWTFFSQFNNITLDVFRKVLDGTIRILNRKEVVSRTKLVIVNDVTSGDDRAKYSSPETIFEGLYRMDDDGNYLSNKSWFKKSGRYPAIPTVYQLVDDTAKAFSLQVNKSTLATRWSTIAKKQTEYNNLFPQEYTGDIFAARSENGWVTYNPYKSGQTASGTIPFKYNTCDSVKLTYAKYSLGVIKEFSNKLTFYLTNFDSVNTSLMTDVVKIYGSTTEPTYSFVDRASHQASSITKSWSGGVLTLNVVHNGPLDLTVNCAGTGTGRLTSYTTASVFEPAIPAIYTGPRQYEAENFDFRNIAGNVTNGTGQAIRNYHGMGYLKFGTNSAAKIRDTVHAQVAGKYTLETRYSASGGNVSTIDLYVNGAKFITPTFKKTANDSSFALDSQVVTLNADANVIMFIANATGSNSVIFDNIVLTSQSAVVATPPTLSITSPTSGSAYTTADSIPFDATATDADGSISHIEFYSDDSLFHSEWTAPYNFTWVQAPTGTHTIIAVAYDNDGNTARDTIQVTVNSAPVFITPKYEHLTSMKHYQIFDMAGKHVGNIQANNLLQLKEELKTHAYGKGIYVAKDANQSHVITIDEKGNAH